MRPKDTERLSGALSDRYERLRDLWQGLTEPIEIYGFARLIEQSGGYVDVSPTAKTVSYGTTLRVKPHQIASDPRLIAEFEGVLAFRRRRPADRSLVIIKPNDSPLSPDDLRAAYSDRANLAWLVFGEIALSPKTERPALRSFGLAPLPGAEAGLLGQARPFGGLGPDVLRAVPTRELVEIVVQYLVGQEHWARLLAARGHKVPHAQREALRRAHAAGSPPKPGRPIDLELYARIAARVSELERSGLFRGTAKAIAAEENVPESTVYRWIAKCRTLGLLPSGGTLHTKGD